MNFAFDIAEQKRNERGKTHINYFKGDMQGI